MLAVVLLVAYPEQRNALQSNRHSPCDCTINRYVIVCCVRVSISYQGSNMSPPQTSAPCESGARQL